MYIKYEGTRREDAIEKAIKAGGSEVLHLRASRA